MEPTRYDILRRENPKVAIWLETLADLSAAKSRIKQIASFWPGRYEVVEHPSQTVVAEVARPAGLGVPLGRMREYARKSFWSGYEWLMAPAPSVAGLAAYTRMQDYARDCYRTSSVWLWAPIARVQAYRSR
jgi:hypothetical protein